MQLVIDISEKDYKSLKHGHIPLSMLNVVMNGTPLPEHHGRLIDADALTIKLKAWDINANGIPNYAWKCIRETLTIVEADKAESEDKGWTKN